MKKMYLNDPVIIKNAEEMVSLGIELGKNLQGGEIFALLGDLGAGKTHCTKGIAIGLGCSEDVTSPTFSLVHEYHSGRCPLYHFDFYRMESLEEVLRIGWDEYLDTDGVIVVEWPNKFTELLPLNTQWLEITHQGKSRVVKRLKNKD